MNFSSSLEALKTGKKLARLGWNGNDMFIFLVKGSTFLVNRPPLNEFYPEGTQINYRPHIDMKCQNGDIVVQTASQSDILAEDWILVT